MRGERGEGVHDVVTVREDDGKQRRVITPMKMITTLFTVAMGSLNVPHLCVCVCVCIVPSSLPPPSPPYLPSSIVTCL